MKRPTFLTVWLVIMAVSSGMTLSTMLMGSQYIQQALPNTPSWYTPLTIGLLILNLYAIYQLWNWKMQGFHIVVGSSVFGLIMSAMLYGLSVAIASSIGAAIGIGILYLAMKPVWKNFK